MSGATRVYCAGWDVFREDAQAFGARVKEAAEHRGLQALWPLDNEVKHALPGERAEMIARANCDSLRSADFVVVNLNPFRGMEPDSGTVFEMGVAFALGKTIVGYMDDADSTYAERLERAGLLDAVAGEMQSEGMLAKDGCTVENFGLPCNLMLVHACADLVRGDVLTALDAVKHLCEMRAKLEEGSLNCCGHASAPGFR